MPTPNDNAAELAASHAHLAADDLPESAYTADEDEPLAIELDNFVSPDASSYADDHDERVDLLEIDAPAPSHAERQAIPVLADAGAFESTGTIADALSTIATEASRNANESSASKLPPIVTTTAPIGAGIVHHATGPSVFERPRPIIAPKLDIVPAADTTAIRLTHGDLIAGSAAEGHGILVGWSGAGDMLRSRLVELATLAGLPEEWVPSPKDPAVQLTRAVKTVAGERGLDPKQERAKDRQTAEARKVDSRWMLATRASEGARVGAKYGSIVLVASLYGDVLEFDAESDAELVVLVRAKFEELVASERYIAADVTRWLAETLRYRLDAVKYGGNWYVPRRHRATAERIVAAFCPSWGNDWMEPPLPIASCDQLARGLSNGPMSEVDKVLADLAYQRQVASEQGREDVGERAACTFLGRLRTIAQRVVAYGALLGDDHVGECRRRVHAAMVDLEAQRGDGGFSSERFDLIWDEIERDRTLATEAAQP